MQELYRETPDWASAGPGASVVIVPCMHDGPTHVYPKDWEFGGANGLDPRADPRWKPDTYEYMNENLESVHLTQVPICDYHALDMFSEVQYWGLNPVFIRVKRHGDTEWHMLPYQYDSEDDTWDNIRKEKVH